MKHVELLMLEIDFIVDKLKSFNTPIKSVTPVQTIYGEYNLRIDMSDVESGKEFINYMPLFKAKEILLRQLNILESDPLYKQDFKIYNSFSCGKIMRRPVVYRDNVGTIIGVLNYSGYNIEHIREIYLRTELGKQYPNFKVIETLNEGQNIIYEYLLSLEHADPSSIASAIGSVTLSIYSCNYSFIR